MTSFFPTLFQSFLDLVRNNLSLIDLREIRRQFLINLCNYSSVTAIQLYGKNWKKVTQHVGTRISAQVRSHAQKVLKDYSPN